MYSKIIIINGPNLNLLGKRQPDIYGSLSFDEYFSTLKKMFSQLDLSYYQSNSEGSIITKIQDVGYDLDGIVINAGAYSHTSIGIADAISAIQCPVVEVHISNIFKREGFRHHSYMSAVCVGVLSGFGLKGYEMAINYFSGLLN